MRPAQAFPKRASRRLARALQQARSKAEFQAQAGQAEMLEVSQIQRAYEQTVGHAVPKSTVYRMLARQDWRKMAPRRRPPRANRQRQRAFKKNFPEWSPHSCSQNSGPSG